MKIDGYPVDSGPDNDPHVACDFTVNFYGYDSGSQSAAITVTPVAPTTGGSPYRTSTSWNVVRSGGNQLDASVTVTQAELSSSLKGVTPQPQQGYHLRLDVAVTGSQGSNDKYKVFWLAPCPGTASSGSSGTQTGSSGTTTSSSGAVSSPTTNSGSKPIATTAPAATAPATGSSAPRTTPVEVALGAGRSAGTAVSTPSAGAARPVPTAVTSPAGASVAAAAPIIAASRSSALSVPPSTLAAGSVAVHNSALVAAGESGSLAYTGVDAAGTAFGGSALIGLGGATVLVTKRRRLRA